MLAVGLLAKLNFVAHAARARCSAWRCSPGGARSRGTARGAGGRRRSPCGVPPRSRLSTSLLNLTVWDRTEWGGGRRRRRARAPPAAGSHAADPISLSYRPQLHVAALPAAAAVHGPAVLRLPVRGTIWFKGFIGNFGWLDTPFRLWVYNLALAITVPLVILACVTLWQRRAGLLRRWPELLTYAAMAAGLLVSIGVLGLRYRRRHRLRVRAGALPAAAARRSTRRRGGARRARRRAARFGASRSARCSCCLAAVHGLFAQLLVISRFYG